MPQVTTALMHRHNKRGHNAVVAFVVSTTLQNNHRFGVSGKHAPAVSVSRKMSTMKPSKPATNPFATHAAKRIAHEEQDSR